MPDAFVSITGQYRRKIRWNITEQATIATPEQVIIEAKTVSPESIEEVISTPEIIEEIISTPEAVAEAEAIVRSGNGHRHVKVRNLFDDEKNTIRSVFVAEDGVAENDRWVRLHRDMDSVVGIFQITGFVSYLHRTVAMGRLTLNNLPRYLEYMRTKHNLWATYNSPKYIAMRAVQGHTITTETIPSLKLAEGFPTRIVQNWSS